jgi:phospholipid N-methyltransferase
MLLNSNANTEQQQQQQHQEPAQTPCNASVENTGQWIYGSATYSPDDNKLRLSVSRRLDTETYTEAKSLGFKWAPKQEIFVAPMWTPAREDFLIRLCGEIEDEDTSLADRAEDRAERFDDYSVKRGQDAEREYMYANNVAKRFETGQPILIGHHSEKAARRDQKRIHNAMDKAVSNWETSEYWTRRAAGALRHAKYKALPNVRHRRIKSIQADQRKRQRNIVDAEKYLTMWRIEPMTKEMALKITNYDYLTVFDASTSSRESFYSLLREDKLEAIDAQARAIKAHELQIKHEQRWVTHYENRLVYERAMLAEQGGIIVDQIKPERGGAVRCLWAPRGGWAYIVKVNRITVTVRHSYQEGGRLFNHNEPFDKLKAVMTLAQVQEARNEGRITETADGAGFYLQERDPNQDPAPPLAEVTPTTEDKSALQSAPEAKTEAQEKPAKTNSIESRREKFLAMGQQLKDGVKICVAPQLYPTPLDVVQKMVDLAEIEPGDRVMEPSAGTGNILREILNTGIANITVDAVEINHALSQQLRSMFPSVNMTCANYLTLDVPSEKYNCILMNPPFEKGIDIKHIQKAFSELTAGGRLVAICANGPRQNNVLKMMTENYNGTWECLPIDTFKAVGTGVRAVLLSMVKP